MLLFKLAQLVFVLLILGLSGIGISTKALSLSVINPFSSQNISNNCTKARSSQGGKVLSWSCSGHSLFSKRELEQRFTKFKTKVITRAGELKYTKSMEPQKINFTYKNGVLSYSGHVSGNSFIGLDLSVANSEDFRLYIRLKYQAPDSINRLGSNQCAIENTYNAYQYPETPIEPFAKKVSGKIQVRLTANQIKKLKTSSEELLVQKFMLLNSDDQNQIDQCNQNVLNSIKNDNLKLRVIYNQDNNKIDGFVKVSGFYIPFKSVVFSPSAQGNWNSVTQNFKDGDIVDIEGDFSPVIPEKYFSWSTVYYMESIKLDYISSVEKVGKENVDKVNFSGKVYLNLNNKGIYFDDYDTTSYTENIDNITVLAVDGAGKEYKTQTNKDGFFEFIDLPIGKYALKTDIFTLKRSYKNKLIDNGEFYGVARGQIREIVLNGSSSKVEILPALRLDLVP